MKKVILFIFLVTQVSFAELFPGAIKFSSSSQEAPVSLTDLKNYILNDAVTKTSSMMQINHIITAENLSLEMVEDLSLNQFSKILSRPKENKLRFQFLYNPNLLHDIKQIMPDFWFFISFGKAPKDTVNTLNEVMINDEAGSLVSKVFVLKKKIESLNNIKPLVNPIYIETIDSKLNIFLQNLNQYELQLKKETIKNEKDLEHNRKVTGKLESFENQEKKLNDLIIANDRSGVRKMLEAYLPWEVMQPFEKESWKTWLEAIEHPNWNDSIVSYRGLDYRTDKLQRTKDGNIGLMWTVLTKNQGSYTRRLRSLTTNRLVNGKAFGMDGAQMTAQFSNHSRKPQASSFLSFTPFIETANEFVSKHGGMIAVRVDSRRMISNITSRYNEAEYLVPLIIFPDEVLHFTEGYPDREKLQEQLRDILENKLKLGSLENVLHAKDYNEKGFEFYSNVIKQVQINNNINQCRNLF